MAEFSLEGLFEIDASDVVASNEAAAESMDDVGDEADELSRDARGAGRSLDRVGDQADDARNSLVGTSAAAGTTSSALSALSVSTSGASLSFGSLTGATIGLTGVLIGLTSVLTPLLATTAGLTLGLGALAGAFGAVVGTGILAFGEQRREQSQAQLETVENRIEALEELEDRTGSLTDAQEDQLETLKDRQDELEDQAEEITGALEGVIGDLRAELAAVIVPFGQEFLPLIRDAVDAIPTLAEDILSATGNLDAFQSSLRAFGGELQTLLPSITSEVFDLAREALPVLTSSLQWLESNAGGIFDGILRTTREVGPLLAQLGGAFFDIAPTINDVGTSILNVLIPAIDDGLAALDRLLQGDIEGGLIDPIAGLIDDTVNYLNSGEGQQLLNSVSSSLFNTLAEAFAAVGQEDAGEVSTALGGALGDALRILSTNLEQSGLLEQLTRLASNVLSGVAKEMLQYVQSDAFAEDLRVVGLALGGALVDAVRGGIEASFSNFNLTAALASQIVKGGAAVDDFIQGQAAENRQNVNTQTGLNLQGSGGDDTTAARAGLDGDGKSIGEEIREALDTMDLALRGELDVSDNVASLEDVDARLERQVRNSRESGTGG